MPYASNAHFGFGHTVDHDVRGKIGNHQLARSHPLPRPAPVRVIGEPFDGFRDSGIHALGSIEVVFGNVVMIPLHYQLKEGRKVSLSQVAEKASVDRGALTRLEQGGTDWNIVAGRVGFEPTRSFIPYGISSAAH